MKKANEIRKIMEQAQMDKIAQVKKVASEFCEQLTEDLLPIAANNGDSFIEIEIPEEIMGYVMDILKDNGYSWTKITFTKFSIRW